VFFQITKNIFFTGKFAEKLKDEKSKPHSQNFIACFSKLKPPHTRSVDTRVDIFIAMNFQSPDFKFHSPDF